MPRSASADAYTVGDYLSRPPRRTRRLGDLRRSRRLQPGIPRPHRRPPRHSLGRQRQRAERRLRRRRVWAATRNVGLGNDFRRRRALRGQRDRGQLCRAGTRRAYRRRPVQGCPGHPPGAAPFARRRGLRALLPDQSRNHLRPSQSHARDGAPRDRPGAVRGARAEAPRIHPAVHRRGPLPHRAAGGAVAPLHRWHQPPRAGDVRRGRDRTHRRPPAHRARRLAGAPAAGDQRTRGVAGAPTWCRTPH